MIRNRKPAYLTVEGRPLCRCEGHHGGLMNQLGLTCGYRSLSDAKRAKTVLQRYRHSVRVVPGFCEEVL